MRQWFDKMGMKFRNWMVGRYGTDELSRCLTWVAVGLMLLSCISALRFLYIPSWIIIIWAYFRVFSKNIYKRSKERDTYLRITGKIRNKFSLLKRMWHDRKTHKYFKCPSCKTMIRVPKGKGKIAITCTKCRNEIIKTT